MPTSRTKKKLEDSNYWFEFNITPRYRDLVVFSHARSVNLCSDPVTYHVDSALENMICRI
jgi:hypothetical protein